MMRRLPVWTILCLLPLTLFAETPNPYPPQEGDKSLVVRWDFETGLQGWTIHQDAVMTHGEGAINLVTSAPDPILNSPRFNAPPNSLVTVSLRVRSQVSTEAQFFWNSDQNPNSSETRKTEFLISKSDDWKIYQCTMSYEGRLQRIRFDPATIDGKIEVDWIQIEASPRPPFVIAALEQTKTGLQTVIQNRTDKPLEVDLNGRVVSLDANSRTPFAIPDSLTDSQLVKPVQITVKKSGFPKQSRTAVLINPDAKDDWYRLSSEKLTLEVSSHGEGARILKQGKPVAVIAPLAWVPGRFIELNVRKEGDTIVCSGGPVTNFILSLDQDQIHYELQAQEEVEGPVVRALGQLEQGLLSGVEHLGRGESSSSTLDIHGLEHIRHEPPYWHVTMPLMAYVTDRASIALAWEKTNLQPTFATPNFYDGTDDHRMSLKGSQISATIRVGNSFAEGGRLADAILWAVHQAGGFPALPETGMTADQERELSLTGLMKSDLYEEGVWYHAIVPGHRKMPDKPKYFSDMASALFRIQGTVPYPDGLQRGGGHIRNDTAFFLTGKVDQWLRQVDQQAANSRRIQQGDGSYRYNGEYQAGHFENTSSGQCALHAVILLEHAQATGNSSSLAAGIKTLEFMKRFRTPRGAQVWECPLHAPDLMASAKMVNAYVIAYELTNQREYLELAVQWALTGVPYIYQWNEWPIQRYASIATLCATHYQAPIWIGRPVQWVGLVYADALLDLYQHDQTLDWEHLSRGILISGIQQQYQSGPTIGSLADSLNLPSQKLLPADINPCSLMTLRLRLEGIQDRPRSVIGSTHRIVSPFPARFLTDAEVEITSPKGVTYQILIDGKEVRTISAKGLDRIPLD